MSTTPTTNENLISTKEASLRSGYNPDYLSRLCRSGKIQGRQIGRTWVVDQDSLDAFVVEQAEHKKQLAQDLARKREEEYRRLNTPELPEMTSAMEEGTQKAVRSFMTVFSNSSFRLPALEVSPRVASIGLTALILGVSTAAAGSGVVASVGNIAFESMLESREKIVLTFSDVVETGVETRAGLAREALNDIAVNDYSDQSDQVTVFSMRVADAVSDAQVQPVRMPTFAMGEYQETAGAVGRANSGSAFLQLTDAYSTALYAYVENVEKVPGSMLAALYLVGDTSARLVATGVQGAPVVYTLAVQEASNATIGGSDLISHTSFAFGEDARSFTGSVLAVQDNAIAAHVRTLREGGRTIARALVSVTDAVPSAIERTVFLSTQIPEQNLASVAASTSDFGSEVTSFFGNMGSLLAETARTATYRLLGPLAGFFNAADETGLATLPPEIPAPPTEENTVIHQNSAPVTVVRNEYSTLTYTGVPQSYVDSKLYLLEQRIVKSAENVNRASRRSNGDSSSVSSLSGVTISNSTWNGGLITNATLDVLDTRVTGSIEASDYIAGPYVLATSTTATSAFSGNIAVGRNATLGSSLSDLLTINSSVASSFIPSLNDTYDLGSASNVWRRGYFDELVVNNFSIASSSFLSQNGNAFGATATIGTNDAQNLAFETNDTVRMTITPLGNVGIATSTPTAKLHVYQTTSDSLAGIQLEQVGGNSGRLYLDSNGVLNIQRGTNNGQLALAGSGNVGIGTTTPNARLEIVSTSSGAPVTGLILNNISGDTSSGSRLVLGASPNLAINSNGRADLLATRQADGSMDLSFLNSPGSAGTPISRFFIQGTTGNIGIGTISPFPTVVGRKVVYLYQAGSGVEYMADDGTVRMKFGSNTGNGFAGTVTNHAFALTTGNAVRLLIDGVGNVGIGTSSPEHPLDVASVAQIYGSDPRIDLKSVTAGTGREYLLQSVGSDGRFRIFDQSGGGERFTVSSTGNVGIGTTTPRSKLDVYGDLSVQTTLSMQRVFNASYLPVLAFSDTLGGVQSNNLSFGNLGGGDLRLITSNVERMRIDSLGNIGIGTSSPLSRVSIVAPSTGGSLLPNSGTTPTGSLFSLRNGNVNNAMFFGMTGTSPFGGYIQVSDVTNLATTYPLLLNPNGGNVGIGTTTPSRTFEVYSSSLSDVANFQSTNANTDFWLTSNAAAAGNVRIRSASGGLGFITGGAVNAFISSTGNVGIGTSTPTAKLWLYQGASGQSSIPSGRDSLVIERNTNNGIAFLTPSSANSFITFSDEGSPNGAGYIGYDHPTDSLRIGTSQVERFRVTSAGNVGIGTSTPTARLQVARDGMTFNSEGTAGLTITNATTPTKILALGYDTNLDASYIQSIQSGVATRPLLLNAQGGNVGIGTTTPNTRLTVTAGSANGINLDQDTTTPANSARLFFSSNTGSGSAIYNSGGTLLFNYNAAAGLTSGVNALAISNTGNVGVGTSTPGSKLEVFGGNLRVVPSSGASSAYFDVIDNAATGVNLQVRRNDNNALTRDLILQGEGGAFSFVGIGTTTRPIAKLTVTGAGITTGKTFSILNSSNTENFTILDSGNVGVGTSTPASALQVGGINGVREFAVGMLSTMARFRERVTVDDFAWTTNLTNGSVQDNAARSSWEVRMGGGSDYFNISRAPAGSGTLVNLFAITGAGNIGIGTTSPATLLALASASTGGTALTLANTDSGGRQYRLFSTGSLNSAGAGSLAFRDETAGAWRMVINSSGNVGIGTTTPWGLLSINPNGITGPSFVVGSSTATNFQITNSGNTIVGPISATNAAIRALVVSGTNSSGVSIAIQRSDVDSGNNNGLRIGYGAASNNALISNFANGQLSFATNGSTAQMTLDTTGNVGIGTTNPNLGKLQLEQSSNAAYSATTVAPNFVINNPDATTLTGYTALAFRTVGSGAQIAQANIVGIQNGTSGSMDFAFVQRNNGTFGETVRISAAGNVGIGTTSPARLFHIASAAPTFVQENTLNGGFRRYISVDGAGNQMFGSFDGAFSTATEHLRITNGGTIGIGTTTPDSRLNVSGGNMTLDNNFFYQGRTSAGVAANLIGLTSGNVANIIAGSSGLNILASNQSTSRLFIDSVGNVGIGTTSPTERLSILSGDNTVTTNVFAVRSNNLTQGVGIGYNVIRGIGTNTNVGLTLDSKGTGDIGFSTNGTQRLTVYGVNGNIGIGTTTPNQVLTLTGGMGAPAVGTGAIGIGDPTISTGALTMGVVNNSYAYIQSWGNRPLVFNSLGNNVGIGTTTPSQLLQVAGNIRLDTSAVNEGLFGISDASGNSIFTLTRQDAVEAGSLSVTSFGGIGFNANFNGVSSASDLYINTTGNVGIGTTTPDGKLSVFKTGSGATSIGAVFKDNVNPTFGSNADNLLTVRGTGSSASTWRGRITAGGDNAAFLMGEYNSQAWLGAHNAALNSWADLYISPDGSNQKTFIGDSGAGAPTPVPILTVSNINGNVGIGTLNPSSTLQIGDSANTQDRLLTFQTSGASNKGIVFGRGAATDGSFLMDAAEDIVLHYQQSDLSERDFHIVRGTSTTSVATFDASGNVGIGTSSPMRALSLGSGQVVVPDGTQAAPSYAFADSPSSGLFYDGSSLNFSFGGTTQFSVGSNYVITPGSMTASTYVTNVGGSALSPAYTFADGGTSGFFQPAFDTIALSTSQTERLRVTSAGNVGIGTTSPYAKLSVAGTIVADNFISTTTATSTFGGGIDIASGCFAIAGACIGSGGGGITSLNGLSASSQTFATGTATGIGLTVVSSGSVHTFTPTVSSGYAIPTTASQTNWNTAFGWGNHAAQGYLTSVNNANWSGTDLSVSNGGTGASTLTGVLIGNGTSAFTGVTTSVGISNALSDETGTGGVLVFASAPTISTPTFNTGNVTLSGSATNIALGSNYLSGDGADEGIFVTAAGSVAIGQTSASTLLDVNGAGTIRGNLNVGAASGPVGIEVGNIAANRDAYIDLVADTTYTDNGLRIARFSGSSGQSQIGHSGTGTFTMGTYQAAALQLFTSNTARLTILSGGNVGILNASPSVELDVTGDIEYTGTITDVSDARLKENVADITNPFAVLSQINGKTYTMLGSSQREVGFIAQEVQRVLPDTAKVVDPATGYLGVSYLDFIPYLVEGANELNSRSLQLSTATTSLAARLSLVENTITSGARDVDADLVTAQRLAVSGNGTFSGVVTAQSFVTPTRETLPHEVLTAEQADLYKMGSYAIRSITALTERTELLSVQVDSIEERVAALEASREETSQEGFFMTTPLTGLLESIGIYVENGVTRLGTLMFRELSVSQDENGLSSAGSVIVQAGNTDVDIENPYVTGTSKVFITFTSPVEGTWYLGARREGRFSVVFSQPQQSDVSFDYFILQSEGQLASPQQVGTQSLTTPQAPAPEIIEVIEEQTPSEEPTPETQPEVILPQEPEPETPAQDPESSPIESPTPIAAESQPVTLE